MIFTAMLKKTVSNKMPITQRPSFQRYYLSPCCILICRALKAVTVHEDAGIFYDEKSPKNSTADLKIANYQLAKTLWGIELLGSMRLGWRIVVRNNYYLPF